MNHTGMNRPDRRRSGELAFSMIEFLVATLILSIGLLGLITLQAAAVYQSGGARSRTTAAYIADWILQRAQVEGQQSYFAKLNATTSNYTALFTASPGQALTAAGGGAIPFGGFNVDGVQVTDAAGANLPNIATQVPDATKRTPVFQASWMRRAYNGGGAPAVNGAQSQEFVVNISWADRTQTRALSLSRVIRY